MVVTCGWAGGRWLFNGVGLVVVVVVWFLLNISANLLTLLVVFLGFVGEGGCCSTGSWWL